MPEYKLLRGTHRREDGTRAEPGELVTLTEAQVEQFNPERFELVAADDEEVESAVTDETSDEDVDAAAAEDVADEADEELTSEASGDLPDDYEMLRSMAVVYDGSEVKGNDPESTIREFFAEFSDTEIAALKERAKDRLYDEPSDA